MQVSSCQPYWTEAKHRMSNPKTMFEECSKVHTHVTHSRQTVTVANKDAVVTETRNTCEPIGERLWYCTTLSYAAIEYGASAKHLRNTSNHLRHNTTEQVDAAWHHGIKHELINTFWERDSAQTSLTWVSLCCLWNARSLRLPVSQLDILTSTRWQNLSLSHA